MDVLATYVRNHWAAAASGVDLADRVARRHRDSEMGTVLGSVAADVREDRSSLRDLMSEIGVTPGVLGPLIAQGAERAGRLKPNGRLVRRSPVSDLLEVEALRAAVLAKRAGWEALSVLSADAEPRSARLDLLQGRADSQVERLTRVHRFLAQRILDGSGPDRDPEEQD